MSIANAKRAIAARLLNKQTNAEGAAAKTSLWADLLTEGHKESDLEAALFEMREEGLVRVQEQRSLTHHRSVLDEIPPDVFNSPLPRSEPIEHCWEVLWPLSALQSWWKGGSLFNRQVAESSVSTTTSPAGSPGRAKSGTDLAVSTGEDATASGNSATNSEWQAILREATSVEQARQEEEKRQAEQEQQDADAWECRKQLRAPFHLVYDRAVEAAQQSNAESAVRSLAETITSAGREPVDLESLPASTEQIPELVPLRFAIQLLKTGRDKGAEAVLQLLTESRNASSLRDWHLWIPPLADTLCGYQRFYDNPYAHEVPCPYPAPFPSRNDLFNAAQRMLGRAPAGQVQSEPEGAPTELPEHPQEASQNITPVVEAGPSADGGDKAMAQESNQEAWLRGEAILLNPLADPITKLINFGKHIIGSEQAAFRRFVEREAGPDDTARQQALLASLCRIVGECYRTLNCPATTLPYLESVIQPFEQACRDVLNYESVPYQSKEPPGESIAAWGKELPPAEERRRATLADWRNQLCIPASAWESFLRQHFKTDHLAELSLEQLDQAVGALRPVLLRRERLIHASNKVYAAEAGLWPLWMVSEGKKPVRLEPAFRELLSAMTDFPKDPSGKPRNVEVLATMLIHPLSIVGRAVEQADLRHLLLDGKTWDTVNTTGQWARAILQQSHEPDPRKVRELLADYVQRGHSLEHLAKHIERFMRDALAERARLSGEEPPLTPTPFGCLAEAAEGVTQTPAQPAGDDADVAADLLPVPTSGRFVNKERVNAQLIHETRGILPTCGFEFTNTLGQTEIIPTDGYLAFSFQPGSIPWLPDHWRTRIVPLALSLAQIRRWLSFAYHSVATARPRLGYTPEMEEVRSLLAHAFLIVRHLNIPNSPVEPKQALDLAGCQASLLEVDDFFRRNFAETSFSEASRGGVPVAPPEQGPPTGISRRFAPIASEEIEEKVRDEDLVRRHRLTAQNTATPHPNSLRPHAEGIVERNKRAESVPDDEANVLARNYLRTHPEKDGSRDVAEHCRIAHGRVSRLPAWQVYQAKKKGGLKAVQPKANRQLTKPMLEAIGKGDTPVELIECEEAAWLYLVENAATSKEQARLKRMTAQEKAEAIQTVLDHFAESINS